MIIKLQKDTRQAVKRECLKMYVNGMGLRAIERVKNVHPTTIINWVKQVGKLLPERIGLKPEPRSGKLKRRLFITPILGLPGRGRYLAVNCQLSTVNCQLNRFL